MGAILVIRKADGMTTLGKGFDIYPLDREAESVEAKALCLEYSEDKEALAPIIKRLTVKGTLIGLDKRDIGKGKFGEYYRYNIIVKYNDKILTLEYGTSIHDTEILKDNKISNYYNTQILTARERLKELRKIRVHFLYSILCSIRVDSLFYGDTFEEFCAEFGYDTDSRSAEKIYHSIIEFRARASRVFTENELSSFPS